MSPLIVTLLVLAAAIIIGLAYYAGTLLAEVKRQQQQASIKREQQQQAIDKKNAYLVDSIQLIAKAIGEQQCELSEGAIRICRLLEKVYIVQEQDYPAQYPALHALDNFLADYPTHQGYKALKRQERMKFDVKRAQREDELKTAIELECDQLVDFNVG